MAGFSFTGSLVLRSPALSFEEQKQSMEGLLGSMQFRMAVFFASPSLYAELSKNGFEYGRLAPAIISSLKRYHNRMCYRPTPFGVFANVSVVQWGEGSPVLLAKEDKLILMPGFELGLRLGKQLEQASTTELLYVNPSLYELPGEYRYYRSLTNDEGSRFILKSINKSKALKKVIKLCLKAQSSTDIIEKLSVDFYPDEAKVFLGQLVAAQVLLSSLLPNITGEPYWEKILYACKGQKNKNSARHNAERFINSLRSVTNSSKPAFFDLASFALPAQVKNPFNVLAFREVQGSLSTEIQQKLLAAIECLRRIVPTDEGPGDLKNFARQFNARFEWQEIPLLQVLDPETGISYGGTDNATGSFDIADMLVAKKSVPEATIEWNRLGQWLLEKITRYNRFADTGIEITDADLVLFPTITGTLPPSTSIIFRPAGKKLLIEEAGGTSATALTARFSWEGDILDEIKSISETEQLNNPDVILADIAYIEDNLSAGVNIRRHIRDYEIPVMVHSDLPDEQQIALNDLYVSCRGDRVFLRSKRLGKYIVPIHGSAYNHERATLPLFRFLCHLHYQDIRYSFTFHMRQYLPGLDHYPRLEYKECILSPAMWVLQADHFLTGSKPDPDKFYDHARLIFLSRYFTWGQHDNQLVFDLYDNLSVNLFLDSVKGQKEIVLSEYFLPNGAACAHNEEGKKFVSQYVAALLNTTSSFMPPIIYPQEASQTVQRCFVPGDKWLYFKIYGHPAMSVLQLVKLLPLIRKFESSGALMCWFFVRYADPAPHLRLRLQVRQDVYANCLSAISRELEKLVEKGSVHSFSLEIYRRELERYGMGEIDIAEKIFEHSSCSVLHITSNKNKHNDPAQKIAVFALLSAERMVSAIIPKLADRLIFAQNVYRSFASQLNISKQAELELDKKYRLISGSLQNAAMDFIAQFGKDSSVNVEHMAAKMKLLTDSCSHGADMQASHKLISDIIHMHMNRLFAKKQREQEAAIYYFMIKYYSSCIGRERAGLVSVC